MKAPFAFSLLMLVLVSALAGWLIGFGHGLHQEKLREVVCDDDVVFEWIEGVYARQAVCNDGIVVTLLD